MPGHLSVECRMSPEEESKTAEREERDMIAESRRTAAEEQQAREMDEMLERNIRQKWKGKESAELDSFTTTKECPARSCGLRVQHNPTSRRTTCKLSSFVLLKVM